VSWRRVYAIILRYSYGIRHDAARLFDLFFWPIVDLLVWGFLTVYLNDIGFNPGGLGLSWLIGGIIFWTLLYRSSQDVAVQLLEDIWARNFLNLFASPLRLSEFITGMVLVAGVKVLITLVTLAVLALWLYHYQLLALGLALVPYLAVLLVFGWGMGLVVSALIIRFGSRVQVFAWGAAFLIQPISAVFYPVAVLPPLVQPLAWLNPATYVFEGMRQVVLHGVFRWDQWLLAQALALGVLALSIWLFAWLFNDARVRGMLTRLD
jgi:ABC-2 type transport system permease protein